MARNTCQFSEKNTMPNVMIRKNDEGQLTLYVPKQDLEDVIVSIEKDSPEEWGGILKLGDGTSFNIPLFEGQPKLPITVRAKRAVGA